MGKKDKKSKKNDDYWDTGFEEDQDLAADTNGAIQIGEEPEEETPAPAPAAAPAADDAASDDESAGEDEPAPKAQPKAAAADPAEPGVQLKSKKEKEREKKEKEKLRKKQQMERKKAAGGAGAAAPAAAVAKAEAPAAAETKAASPAPAPAGKSKDGKPKKKSAVLLALERQVEAQRKAEEAQRLAEEEERKRIEEEERLAAEEARLKEEAKAKKKEKERLKREELKKEGKLLSKKQKEAIALQQKRIQQMKDAGIVVAGLSGEGDTKKKRPVYQKKKKGASAGANENDDDTESKLSQSISELSVNSDKDDTPEPEAVAAKPVAVAEPAAESVTEPAAKEDADEDGEPIDSWENAALSENEAEDIQESWEQLLDSDNENGASKPKEAANGSAKASEQDTSAAKAKAEAAAAAKAEAEAAAKAKALEQRRKLEAKATREKRIDKAMAARSRDDLRSPICCILGHVDTGKTKLLDKVRQTNVQEGEAGGITQQIGATYFPIDAIKQKTAVVNQDNSMVFNVPGLLVIDTPGHESFTNLRSRGSSLCNIAILVIDIMHGLEQQTLESIRLLRSRKTPFVVALNKIDRLYGWESIPDNGVQDSLSKQSKTVQREFEDRVQKTKVALAEQGLNSELYYKNKNLARNVSLVPTSAVTGEGVPDLLKLLIDLTQTRMSDKLMYLSELECTILEVKVIEGLGMTIDVVLSNGILREGDRVVLCGMNGPIATNVRALLTPQPLRELRIKSAYVHHKEVKAALGVKIAANDLDKAIAGSRLLLVGPDDDEDELMDEVMSDLTGLEDAIDKSGRGVCVQASTLGSLEALLDFLKQMKIPVMSISIGPVFKRDVMKATTMLEKAKEFAVMLCFDVKIDKEAEQYAEEQGIKIFSADIIYHLFDAFENYQKQLLEEKRKANSGQAVFPCVLNTIKVINKRNPMIIGVDVVEGSVRLGTPIATVRIDPATQMRQVLQLGKVVSLEVNHKNVDIVKKGQAQGGVAMRLDTPSNQPTWGRHVDETDTLYSEISRSSIDTLKDPAFRDDVSRDEWLLLRNLKGVFSIA
ncbi:uncharacterized protein V1510DRAFT_412756 [Dipodascopsis tothii]|uniref:uncharacterized protein n=1 Tax=Dipodascopsis tothii TaxID=44089 RepID=UPI0034CE3CFE